VSQNRREHGATDWPPVGDPDVQIIPNGFAHESGLSLWKIYHAGEPESGGGTKALVNRLGSDVASDSAAA